MLDALGLIDTWPARTAAAAVVAPSGHVHRHGPGGRRFRLASVTKILVAYAVLVAVEEGTLDLDQPAGPPGSTVRHLLAHASGLEGLTPGGPAAADPPRVVAAPGTRRTYSNAGFEALGDALEAAAGMPVATYLDLAVCRPLGLTATVLEGSPAYGAWSTVDDLTAWVGEVLEPRLIDRATLADATTVQFPGLAGIVPGYGRHDHNDWGLGFEIRNGKVPHWTGTTNSPATFGHFGASGTFVWVDPTAGAAAVVLTDLDHGPWAATAWPPFSDAVLAELRAGGSRPPS